MTIKGTGVLLTAAALMFAALIGLASPASAAGDRDRPGARVVVQERGQKARLVGSLRHLPWRGRTRVAHTNIRAAGKTWSLKKKFRNRWIGAWRPAAAVTRLRGRWASVKVKRKTIRRNIRFKVKIVGKRNIPDPPGPDLPPVPPPVPPDPAVEPTAIYVPGLVPSWSGAPTDFTVECGSPVRFSVISGDAVSIDGRSPQAGAFAESVTLLPGQSTSIKTGGKTQTVRCRPTDLPLPAVEGRGDGLYLASPTVPFGLQTANYVMVLNGDGVPVWWSEGPDAFLLDFKLIDGETFAWTRAGPYGFVNEPNHYDLRKFDGSLAGTVDLAGLGVGADHHDLQPTPDGGWLVIGYVPRDCPNTPADCEDLSPWGGPAEANLIDGVVQKVDSENELVWQWSTRDHIATAESADWISRLGSGTALPGGNSFDTVHMNSVEPSGDGFVFSARHLNAVYRVEDADGAGAIDWKLGGTPTPESLSVTGDPLAPEVLGGQHDARILDDGSLTVYDNGTERDRPPRLVRYSISGGNATLLESVMDERVPGSTCCGSARRLANGNWLAAWGANDQVAEYSPDGSPLFRLTWPGGLTTYRATQEGLDRLDPEQLRAGMDSQFPR